MTDESRNPTGFIQDFQGKSAFNWELEDKYDYVTPSDDRLCSNPNLKTIVVSSIRPKDFVIFCLIWLAVILIVIMRLMCLLTKMLGHS